MIKPRCNVLCFLFFVLFCFLFFSSLLLFFLLSLHSALILLMFIVNCNFLCNALHRRGMLAPVVAQYYFHCI